MQKNNTLVEIKKKQTGTGLLLENDGYMDLSMKENAMLKESVESFKSGDLNELPRPFVVSAVLQKYGIENANGRIYPEDVLKREVEKYQTAIKERRAFGECYRPTAMILTEAGWKQLQDVQEGENILTLNPNTKEVEIKPIKRVIRNEHDGDMIRVKGRSINNLVTPEHGYPTLDRNGKFSGFVTALDIYNGNVNSHSSIPKVGKWIGRNDEVMVIPSVKEFAKNAPKSLKKKYSEDLVIPMDIFAKFMGIYLSEGCCDKKNPKYRVMVFQKKECVCDEIENLLNEWGIQFSINVRKNGCGKTFVINDKRLNLYLRQFGNCYDKFVPFELKQQNSEILRLFYDWFVMGDGRITGDKRRNTSAGMTTDVFSSSKRLALDLAEVIFKIGYSPTYHMEKRDNERLIEGRIIKSENTHPMHFAFKALTKGIYLDKRFLTAEKEYYKGEVMCVEVDNHIWYVMENGKAHWTKNCNHPESSVIDVERICMDIIEMHWVGHTLIGKVEIPITEGFRKYGICSTLADTVAQLLVSGIRIGVSSRALGSVERRADGVLLVQPDLEILAFDVVATPSTPGANLVMQDADLQPFIQESGTAKTGQKINENTTEQNSKFFRFAEWLKD